MQGFGGFYKLFSCQTDVDFDVFLERFCFIGVVLRVCLLFFVLRENWKSVESLQPSHENACAVCHVDV